MSYGTLARADWRVLISAAVVGSAVGLGLGAFYLAGGMARAAAEHSHVTQLVDAADSATLAADGLRDAVALVSARRPSTARDLDCLTQAVYFEARGETPRGQAAVATVVLNRVRKVGFPKTVCGVVFQGAATHGCQFSFACDGSMHHGLEADAWDRARGIAARALSGVVLAEVGSATHFHTTAVSPEWGPQMMRVAQVGLHVFYRFNPHAPISQPQQVERAVFVSQPSAPTGLRLAKAMLETASDATANAVPASAMTPASAMPDAKAALTKASDTLTAGVGSTEAAAS